MFLCLYYLFFKSSLKKSGSCVQLCTVVAANWHDQRRSVTCWVSWTLKINGSHNLYSLGRVKEKERGRVWRVGEGGFFTWACHHGVQLIIIFTVTLSPSTLSLCRVMAISSCCLLLPLIISFLDWLSSPASAFLIDRDHVTSSGR